MNPDMPRDIVPGRPLDLAVLAETIGLPVVLQVPGELIEDPDGMPVGVGPSTTVEALVCGVMITRAEAIAQGMQLDALPAGVRVFDPDSGQWWGVGTDGA